MDFFPITLCVELVKYCIILKFAFLLNKRPQCVLILRTFENTLPVYVIVLQLAAVYVIFFLNIQVTRLISFDKLTN